MSRHHSTVHPGEILSEDFLKPEGISQASFTRHIGVDPVVISEIVNGRRGLSPEMCVKFGAAFGDGADIWWSLQCAWDYSAALKRLRRGGRLPKIKTLPPYAEALSAGQKPAPKK